MAALAADINVETVGRVVIGTFAASAAETYYQGSSFTLLLPALSVSSRLLRPVVSESHRRSRSLP